MKNTFAKGVHPLYHKEWTSGVPITDMPAPKVVYIPIQQHIGAKPEIVVSVGQAVNMGQLIAKAGGFVSSNIHSSVSGTVKAITVLPLSNGDKVEHIVIDNNFADTAEKMPKLTNPTKEELLERIRLAGIVGMGGAGFPTDVKLTPPKDKSVDTLLINGAECEPYITCDHRIMLEYTEQFVKGVQYLMQAVGVTSVVIGIEENKTDAAKRVDLYLKNERIEGITTTLLKVKYPQGAEKQLIYAVLKRRVPNGGLPSDVGAVVCNVHTALSTYFAVWDGQPVFRRIMTVSGCGCEKPNNIWVRNGTPVSEIMAYCGFKINDERLNELQKEYAELFKEVEELKSEKSPELNEKAKALAEVRKNYAEAKTYTVHKVINGGPMMGTAIANKSIASTKTMSCLLMLTESEINTAPITQCINCGKCASHCPMNLMPMFIDSYEFVKDWASAKRYGAMDCIQCGCCAYICPAKKPLVQSIAYAKKMIRAKKI